jgi:hypothetical protein
MQLMIGWRVRQARVEALFIQASKKIVTQKFFRVNMIPGRV